MVTGSVSVARSILTRGSIAGAALLYCGTASAIDFEIGGTPVQLENLVTVGGILRMQERDSSLVGKSSLNPGLCVSRTNADFDPSGGNRFSGDTCTSTELEANERFVEAPGSYNPNGDNGNLNYDRHDVVSAAAKLTTDLSFEVAQFRFFARSLYFFDAQYSDLDETHPDTTLQPASTPFPDAGEEQVGNDLRMLDYFVSRNFTVAEREFGVKVGNQVMNWGESGFLALNSLNAINPPNQALSRLPGSDIKEVFQPVGMVFVSGEVADSLNIEAFYQYDWKPVELDPVGSFFSSSDTLGAGGQYAMLSFGKAPEDPYGLYAPVDNLGIPGLISGDPLSLIGSQASRTLFRDRDREPSDTGQYGIAAKLFLQDFNNGTELGFYYANYHSRIPAVSFIAAQASCIPTPTAGGALTNLPALIAACGIVPGVSSASEPLPVDTARLFAEYPEDIHLVGLSFSTTLGDIAWSGEYAYRPNLPVQIHTTDLTFAALNPAFPEQDYNVGIAVLPGRRHAVPDFVSVYRGIEGGYAPGAYIQGYERLKVGQFGTTLLKSIGAGNFLRASQITLLLELGLTHVIDMPDLSELQFQGAATDTHISHGADGSGGINPADVRGESAQDESLRELRQNPTRQDPDNFGDDLSYGYRLVTLTRFDSLIFGANIELLNALFHDVHGVAPGLGQNFVEGRKQILSGVRFDFLSTWAGELRYTWFTGGGDRDVLRDRDNLLLFLSYSF